MNLLKIIASLGIAIGSMFGFHGGQQVAGSSLTTVPLTKNATVEYLTYIGDSLGIGTTTTPTSRLNVSGTTTASCFSSDNGVTCLSSGGSGTVNSGTSGQVAAYNTTGTAVSGTSTIFLTGGNVGIGTTNPLGIFGVKNNGIDMSVGSSGCTAGFLYINFSASPSCSNYSFLGDGTNTYLNGVSAVNIANGNSQIMSITTSSSFGQVLLQKAAGNLIVNQAGEFYLDNSTNNGIHIRPGGQNESATFSSSGNLGVQNTNPTFTLDVGSKAGIDPFRVASSTGSMVAEILKSGLQVQAGVLPTTATSTGIGTGASTATVTGSTNKLHLVVNTGTSPAGSNALITTVTLPQACPVATIPVISDANPNSDALGITALVFASSTSASAFGVYSGSAGLTGATIYMWNIDVGCY